MITHDKAVSKYISINTKSTKHFTIPGHTFKGLIGYAFRISECQFSIYSNTLYFNAIFMNVKGCHPCYYLGCEESMVRFWTLVTAAGHLSIWKVPARCPPPPVRCVSSLKSVQPGQYTLIRRVGTVVFHGVFTTHTRCTRPRTRPPGTWREWERREMYTLGDRYRKGHPQNMAVKGALEQEFEAMFDNVNKVVS